MGYGDYLKELLRPMGIYVLDNSVNGAELDCVGDALDAVGDMLEEVQREMNLATAEDSGLDAIEELLGFAPVTTTTEGRREALAALLRISGDSFTVTAINDTLKGCGLNVVAAEGEEAQTVYISFPDVPGIPDGIDDMKEIIEAILPCHLNFAYVYWYITWALMEERFATWGDIEAEGLSWGELEKLVMLVEDE